MYVEAYDYITILLVSYLFGFHQWLKYIFLGYLYYRGILDTIQLLIISAENCDLKLLFFTKD